MSDSSGQRCIHKVQELCNIGHINVKSDITCDCIMLYINAAVLHSQISEARCIMLPQREPAPSGFYAQCVVRNALII